MMRATTTSPPNSERRATALLLIQGIADSFDIIYTKINFVTTRLLKKGF